MHDIYVTFIGCGAMGGALAQAVKRARAFKPHITVTALHKEDAQAFAKRNRCSAAESNAQAASGADIVFIAVKPHDVESVVRDVSPAMREGALLVSMAAGVMLETLGQYTDRPVARIMPNVGAAVGQGMTAICYNSKVSEAQKDEITSVLGTAGTVCEVEERLMPCVTAVSGSSPAYVFMFIEALSDAAVRGGMRRADAYTFASQTVLGAATLAVKSGKLPAALKDAVCSPAGTTIEGLAALEEHGFRAAVMAAVDAAIKKA